MIGIFLLVYLSSKIHPFKILKAKLLIFWIFVLICPYLLYNIHSPYSLMIMQCLVMFFALSSAPLSPIIGKQFTVFKRFTYISFIFSLSIMLSYLITSFGFVYLVDKFGHFRLLVVMIPMLIGYTISLFHFEKLEKQRLKLIMNC